MINNILRSIKLAYFKLLRINDSPHKIAMGFAIGSFIGIFPTFWLGGILAVFLSWIFRLNYVATILGAFIIMNPLTTPLFWILSAFVGGIIFSKKYNFVLNAIKDKSIFHNFGDLAIIYLVGNTIISLIVAVFSYWAIKRIIIDYRKRKSRIRNGK
ncbi:MAG: DUF2062 domain-containing protein [Elusimicrobia bacterium]|nr:DUF2062 domain-containing protein [Elusimicrobiota bacterium]